MPDRYYIVECWGWGIGAGKLGGSSPAACSYSILDRLWNHREVWRDYSKLVGGKKSRVLRAAAVIAECERLNADERAWEAASWPTP